LKEIKVKIINDGITVIDKDGKKVEVGEEIKVPESHYKKYKPNMMRVNVKKKA
jgi:hypothetical protein